jgi:hypothetical protein
MPYGVIGTQRAQAYGKMIFNCRYSPPGSLLAHHLLLLPCVYRTGVKISEYIVVRDYVYM